jgi:hypothetical protein
MQTVRHHFLRAGDAIVAQRQWCRKFFSQVILCHLRKWQANLWRGVETAPKRWPASSYRQD